MLENMQLPVLIILGLPVVAAVVVAALGSRNRTLVRWIALTAVSINLLLTGVLVVKGASVLRQKNQQIAHVLSGDVKETFEPEFTPGDAENSHRTTWDLFEIPIPSGDGK